MCIRSIYRAWINLSSFVTPNGLFRMKVNTQHTGNIAVWRLDQDDSYSMLVQFDDLGSLNWSMASWLLPPFFSFFRLPQPHGYGSRKGDFFAFYAEFGNRGIDVPSRIQDKNFHRKFFALDGAAQALRKKREWMGTARVCDLELLTLLPCGCKRREMQGDQRTAMRFNL